MFQVRLKYMFWVALEVSAWVLPRINLLWPTRKTAPKRIKGRGKVTALFCCSAFEVRLRYLLAAFEVCLRCV